LALGNKRRITLSSHIVEVVVFDFLFASFFSTGSRSVRRRLSRIFALSVFWCLSLACFALFVFLVVFFGFFISFA